MFKIFYMIKYYLFYSYQKLNKTEFDEIIRNLYSYYSDIEYENNNSGIIMADENFYFRLDIIQNVLLNDLNINLIFLETFDLNNISYLALNYLIDKRKSGLYSLDEVIFDSYINKIYILSDELIKIFNQCDKDLLNTAKYYLKANMNSVLASKYLYVHRNTFDYRLNKFKEITKLDIKNYKNALIFDLYLKINSNN